MTRQPEQLSRVVQRMIVGILLVGLILFIFFRFRPLARGPEVVVEYPPPHEAVESGFVTVTGTVRHVAKLSINGAEVLPTTDNRFTYALLVPPGYSILYVYAEDRFGKTFSQEVPLYLDALPDSIEFVSPPEIDANDQEESPTLDTEETLSN